MTETMTLTIKMDADSLTRTARMLEAAADALGSKALDFARRQEAQEAEAFARAVAQMTAEEVQRVNGYRAELEADDAGQRAARAESEDNDDPSGEDGEEPMPFDVAVKKALFELGAERVETFRQNDDSFELVITGGDDQEIARAIHASLPTGTVTRGNTLIGFTGDDGRIHEVRFSRPQRKVIPIEPPARAATDVELDSAGYAWDERIHSSARTKTKEGRWKYIRGVDKALVALLESKAAPAPGDRIEAAAITEPDHSLEEAQAEVEYKPMQHTPPPGFKGHVPPPPPPAAAPAPAGQLIEMQPDPASITTFRQLMPYIGKHKFTQAQLMEACRVAGAQSVPVLMQRQDLIPAVVTALEAQRAAKA